MTSLAFKNYLLIISNMKFELLANLMFCPQQFLFGSYLMTGYFKI